MFPPSQNRIIVVDDSTPIQKIFRIALSKFPIEIVICNSLQEALLASNINLANLLVVDAHLPDIQSPQDIIALQEKNEGAPVLLLVGTHESIDLNEFKRVGIQNILKKPFEIQDLIHAVKSIIGDDAFAEKSEAVQAPMIRMSLDGMDGPPLPPPLRPQLSGPAALPVDFSYSPEISMDFTPPPPPPQMNPIFESDQGRKGRRVFSEVGAPEPSKDNHEPQIQADFALEKSKIENLRKSVEEFLVNDAPVIVRKAVEKYCETHFQELAREILSSEIRRLAEERSRILSN